MKKIAFFTLLAFLTAVTAYSQTVIFGNTGNASLGGSAAVFQMQRFNIVDANKYITEVSLLLNKVGAPTTEQFTVSIYNYVETGNNVGMKVTDLYTGYISSLSGTPTILTVNIYNKNGGLWPLSLNEGSSYWLVLYSSSSLTYGPEWSITADPGGNGSGFSLQRRYGSDVSSLTSDVLVPYQMLIKAGASPAIPMVGKGKGDHSIALRSDGKVYTWGSNFFGQLGDDTYSNSNIPVAVADGNILFTAKTIVQVAAGYGHNIALDDHGRVFTWGNNTFGQLGDGTDANSYVPVAVANGDVLFSHRKIVQVAAGYDHCIALSGLGKVYTWGNNFHGELGNDDNTSRNVPVAVEDGSILFGNKNIVHIAAGYDHSIALDDQGRVYTWGSNDNGELGNGDVGGSSNVPVAVADGSISFTTKNIVQIAAGRDFSIALDDQGRVYSWGYNLEGQLGDGTDDYSSNVPVEVADGGVAFRSKKIIQIAAGYNHSIALDDQGKVYTWGFNENGQLGENTYDDLFSNVPLQVADGSVNFRSRTITWIGTGDDHCLAIASDGTVFSWGSNTYGQLGIGQATPPASYEPLAVSLGSMGPLPVELSLFSASVNGKNVQLRWETATEMMNYGFDVERKMKNDAGEWQKIGFVAGNGNSNSVKRYSFTDDGISAGVWQYRLKQLDTDGSFEYSKIVEVDFGAPEEFALNQNYPNPFNPSTTISFSVPVGGYVSLAIFNLLGEKVAEPINKIIDAGNYTVDFDATGLSSGLYFYTLKAGEYSAVRKMVLTK